jgi:hypothetical protein
VASIRDLGFGVSDIQSGDVQCGEGTPGRADNSEKKNAQHLEVIEWCYGLWVGPLVEKEEVEKGGQDQTPEDPYVFRSPDVWTPGFK